MVRRRLAIRRQPARPRVCLQTRYLPPNLMALFAPREPIEFKPPIESKPAAPLTGVGQWVNLFEDEPTPHPGAPRS